MRLEDRVCDWERRAVSLEFRRGVDKLERFWAHCSVVESSLFS